MLTSGPTVQRFTENPDYCGVFFKSDKALAVLSRFTGATNNTGNVTGLYPPMRSLQIVLRTEHDAQGMKHGILYRVPRDEKLPWIDQRNNSDLDVSYSGMRKHAVQLINSEDFASVSVVDPIRDWFNTRTISRESW